MTSALKLLVLATLVAAAQIAGVAWAQGQAAPSNSASTRATIPSQAPSDWIIYDNTTYTPVIDVFSQHIDAARKAFDAKDKKKAAAELRAASDELKLQADRAEKEDATQGIADTSVSANDKQAVQDAVKRVNAGALKLRSAAADVESGKIKTKADLDKVIDKAARADMDRRWLITDVATWYPVSAEPQRHFTDAVADYARKDYKTSAADIRKAAGYLRIEANRTTGKAKQELENSAARLDKLATSVGNGVVKAEQSMATEFAKANHALALEHRSKAIESWARKEYGKAGYELKASAQALESAAGWAGKEAAVGASGTVKATRNLGDKLVAGSNWTRDEVSKGFESLGNSIRALGNKLGRVKKA